jgi:hypothetical protein
VGARAGGQQRRWAALDQKRCVERVGPDATAETLAALASIIGAMTAHARQRRQRTKVVMYR